MKFINTLHIVGAVALLANVALAAEPTKPVKPTYQELEEQVDYWKSAYQVVANQYSQLSNQVLGQQVDLAAKDMAAKLKAEREAKSKK